MHDRVNPFYLKRSPVEEAKSTAQCKSAFRSSAARPRRDQEQWIEFVASCSEIMSGVGVFVARQEGQLLRSITINVQACQCCFKAGARKCEPLIKSATIFPLNIFTGYYWTLSTEKYYLHGCRVLTVSSGRCVSLWISISHGVFERQLTSTLLILKHFILLIWSVNTQMHTASHMTCDVQ